MEKSLLFVGSGLSALILNLFGEWDMLITFLLIAVTLDYFTGMIASGIEGKLSSKFGIKGIGRKVLIFSLVTVAHLVVIKGTENSNESLCL